MIRSASASNEARSSWGSRAFRKRIQRTAQRKNALLDEVDDVRADSRAAIARLSDDLIEGTRNARDAVDTRHRRAAAQRMQRANGIVAQRIGADFIRTQETLLEHLQM